MSFLAFLHHAVDRQDLTFDQARGAMSALLEGGATPALTAAFLVALRMKGETAEELAGFASAMREHMVAVEIPSAKSGPETTEPKGLGAAATSGRADFIVDSCGTGGDASGTFNISTTAAFVMAGAGAIVAKHGNRSVSSTTGSADVLEALGVSVTATAEEAAQRLQDIGIAFLFAPAFHPAMKHVQPIRRELKLRTIFNLLGPLANPARAQSQVIGVPSTAAAKLVADALAMLGAHRVFVVHGSAGESNVPGAPAGVDEISISGPTEVLEIRGNKVTPHIWRPAMFGVGEAPIEALAGGDAQVNAQIALQILMGEKGPRRDIVVVNAAAGLVACGLARDLQSGAQLAAQSIDSGAARQKLEQLRLASPADGPVGQVPVV